MGPPAIEPRLPMYAPEPVPADLEDLLNFSRTAARTLDHVGSWRAVSAFARDHWLTEADGLPDDVTGEFYALRHAVADQLELPDEAAEARTEWLEWARRTNRPAAILHARAFGAYAEAERFADATPAPNQPADEDIPELISVSSDILATTPTGEEAYQAALAATIVGAAASMCRRADLAGALSTWAREHSPLKSAADDRRLLDAQIAHGRGDLHGAALMCEAVAEDPVSEPVTSTIEARQMLAWLSVESDQEAEAIRQLRPVVRAGVELDLTVATLRSHRLLTALLNGAGEYEEARDTANRILAHTAGMPVNPLTMDLDLILARSLFDAGEYEAALRHAEPVAQWSTMSDDEERTDAAYTISAASSVAMGRTMGATMFLLEHAEHLQRVGDNAGASSAMRQAARTVVRPMTTHDSLDDVPVTMDSLTEGARVDPDLVVSTGKALELAEDMMLRARGMINDGWSIADWHDDLAYIYWATGNEQTALGHVDTASAGYQEAGDGVEAARALLTGVRCCLDLDDEEGVRRYTIRINELLPEENWHGHPVRETLAELLGE